MISDSLGSNIVLPYWSFAIAIATSFYIGMVFIGKHLSIEAKNTLALWLKGSYESTWSHHFCDIFDTLFGKRHLSISCFIRSSIASFLSVLALYFLFAHVLGILETRTEENLTLWQVILFGALINIIPDYLSLFETRWLLQRFEQVRSFFGQSLVLLLDAFFTGAIISVFIALFKIFRGETLLASIEMVALYSVFSIFFYSTFLTSVWAWLYCLTTWMMRVFSRTGLSSLLDVEKNPMSQIAFVGSITILFIGFTFTYSLRNIDIDDSLCSTFPEYTCKHAARLSKTEKQALKNIERLCSTDSRDAPSACISAAEKYFQGDELKSALLWEKACILKQGKACFYLAWMHEEGYGVEKDKEIARKLYGESCRFDYFDGCFNHAVLSMTKTITYKDTTNAINIFKKSCKNLDPEGCANLGNIYIKGHPKLRAYNLAYDNFQISCDLGNQNACFDAAWILTAGVGVHPDHSKALHIFHRLCESKYYKGCTGSAIIFNERLSEFYDPVKAMYHLKNSCQNMEVGACQILGWQEVKNDTSASFKKAYYYFDRSCKLDTTTGCTGFAWLTEKGLGTEKNVDRAYDLYSLGCDSGNAKSCKYLSKLVSKQNSVSSAVNSDKYFERSCLLGDSQACHTLGNDYLIGDRYSVNYQRSIHYFTQSCHLGNDGSCFELAALFSDQDSPEVYDLNKSVSFYRKGCSMRHSASCFNLALIFHQENAFLDKIQALSFYQKSCEYGDIDGCAAMNELAPTAAGK